MDLVPLVVSAAIAAVIAPGFLRVLPTRPNFKGSELPFPAGAVAVAAGILSLGVLAFVQRILDHEGVDEGSGFGCP